VIDVALLYVPATLVSTAPTITGITAEIVGAVRAEGSVPATPVIGPISFEYAVTVPSVLVPYSRKLMIVPSSAATVTYVRLLAPAIANPSRSQVRVIVGVGVPVHVAATAVNVEPRTRFPEITGLTVATGATGVGVGGGGGGGGVGIAMELLRNTPLSVLSEGGGVVCGPR